MKIEELVRAYTTRVDGALVGQIVLDLTVYTVGNFFQTETLPAVNEFYRQSREAMGLQWSWVETDSSAGPRRVDLKSLELFPSWFSSGARRREEYRLFLRNGDKEDDIGTCAFECGAFGNGNLPGYLRLSCPVETYASRFAEYAALCVSLLKDFPFWCARAGYSLRWNEYSETHYRRGLERAQWLADWYHGIDLPDDSMIVLNDGAQGRIPAINWLTFINSEQLGSIGGREALQSRLPPSVVLHELRRGVALQAGAKPETGNSPQPDDLAAYRAVAEALKPLRIGNYPNLIKDPAAWFARFDPVKAN